jgi:hypothetical protein
MMIFDEEVIPVARELASDNATRLALVDEAESITVNASDSVGNAQVLLDSGQVYDSANALDDGISMFTALLEREDMLFILES